MKVKELWGAYKKQRIEDGLYNKDTKAYIFSQPLKYKPRRLNSGIHINKASHLPGKLQTENVVQPPTNHWNYEAKKKSIITAKRERSREVLKQCYRHLWRLKSSENDKQLHGSTQQNPQKVRQWFHLNAVLFN